MKLKKKLIFIGIFFIYSTFYLRVAQTNTLLELYNGIPFMGNMYFYFIHFFMIAIYSLYIFTEYERFLKNQGIYIVIREESKRKLYCKMTKLLTKDIFCIEIMKLSTYSLVLILFRRKVELCGLDTIFKFFITSFLSYFLMFFIQMNIELFFSSQSALISILSYYLFSVFIGDIIYSFKWNLSNCLFFIPNITMKERLLQCNESILIIILLLSITIVILYKLCSYLFTKIDII